MPSEFQLQKNDAHEAGLSTIAAAAWTLGDKSGIASIRARCKITNGALQLAEIPDILPRIGLQGRLADCADGDVSRLVCPAILDWSEGRFVTLKRCLGARAEIFHPENGWQIIRQSELRQKHRGGAVEVSKSSSFRKMREEVPLNLFSLFRWTPSIVSGLTQILILSLVLQAYLLLSPLYMRVVMDETVMRSDRELLDTVALGFLMLAIFNGGATLLRGITVQSTSSLLDWDMTRRVFNHMMRLPLEWFQRRRLADAFVRFQALEPVRQLISNGLISVLIDSVLSLTIVAALAILSPLLAIIVMVGVIIYAVIRFASVPLTLRYSGQALTASIAEQGKRIEAIKAIQSIKAMGAEADREDDWASSLGESVRTSNASNVANVALQSVQTVFVSLTTIVVIYFGAGEILSGRMTVGTLLACIAYQSLVAQRVCTLLDVYVQWRLLDMWNTRIADIVLTPTEVGSGQHGAGTEEVALGQISVRKVFFRYSSFVQPVLRGTDLEIQPGEFVAILGASGSGKSTLMKLICGLYAPGAGEILLDGKPISHWGVKRFRKSFGIVLQDDVLLAGSIAENISSFDAQTDRSRVWEYIREVGLEEEIGRMPLGIDTQIVDIGSTLSGGQSQRVQIARALYRSPPILLLDEATSHLDPSSEDHIAKILSNYKGTRIVIAHSERVIKAADRVLTLQDGVLVNADPPKRTIKGFF